MSDNSAKIEIPKLLLTLGAIGLLIFVVAIGAYWKKFGEMDISQSTENWGQFGDYLAGAVGPPIALLAFVGLLWTIHINQIELRLTRGELKTSREALQQNNIISESRANRERIEEQKNDLSLVIHPLTSELEGILDRRLSVPDAIRMDGGERINLPSSGRTLRDLLTDQVINEYRKHVYPNNLGTLTALAEKIVDLEKYLRAYERLAGDEFFTGYHKSRFEGIVTLLVEAGQLKEQDVLDFFQQGPDVLKMAEESIEKASKIVSPETGQLWTGRVATFSKGPTSLIDTVNEKIEMSDRIETLVIRGDKEGRPRDLPYVSVHTYPKPNDPDTRLAIVSWAYSSTPPGGVPPPALAIEKEPMSHEEAMQWGQRVARSYGFPTLYWIRDE